MDLLTQLDHELSGMHLNDFEKVRYIYLRTCELFSFDARYNVTGLFSDDKLFNEIINRRIDIRNIEDYLVVCHSYSRDVLIKLIRELTGADVELQDGAHSYVKYFQNPDSIWLLDATYGDLARVKLSLDTHGFNSTYPHNIEILSETDAILGYNPKTKEEYLSQIDMSSKESIFQSINLLLKRSKCRKEFSDALFFVKWLLCGINFYTNNSCYVGNGYSFHQFFTFPETDGCFCLSKEENNYELKSIAKKDCMRLTRNLRTSDDIFCL